MSESAIILKREVTATRIPQGEALVLPKGTPVIITQALGGSYTVVIPTEAGLYRIGADFADALGKEIVAETAAPSTGEAVTEQQVWDVLKTCYDPEIPVNIVDLGLIYDLRIETASNGAKVSVQMTLTAPGCGMGPVIAREAQQKIVQLCGVADADVQVIWEPPWTPDKISTEGKQKLGIA
ncbi:MAG TPA: iron-sulfur cluster assembly protein [Chthoniobacteraceae bacterium]|jgi:probable FeS assembly SUF system protein SufT|nr:iron-sulfur cluster assembly protein [Chthoniobacteraceae bacterium]